MVVTITHWKGRKTKGVGGRAVHEVVDKLISDVIFIEAIVSWVERGREAQKRESGRQSLWVKSRCRRNGLKDESQPEIFIFPFLHLIRYTVSPHYQCEW